MDDMEILVDSLKMLIKVYAVRTNVFENPDVRTREYNNAYQQYLKVKNTIRDTLVAVKLSGIERMIIYGHKE